jgi:hypothetical protein
MHLKEWPNWLDRSELEFVCKEWQREAIDMKRHIKCLGQLKKLKSDENLQGKIGRKRTCPTAEEKPGWT